MRTTVTSPYLFIAVRWPLGRQLGARVPGEALEDPLAGRPQTHHDLAPIAAVPPSLNHAGSHQTVDQLNDGVMADLQTFGQHAHRRHLMPFESLDLEQHEILLRLHPRRAGGDFADAKKASYLIAEIREGSIIGRTQGHGGHAPESIYHLMICFVTL